MEEIFWSIFFHLFKMTFWGLQCCWLDWLTCNSISLLHMIIRFLFLLFLFMELQHPQLSFYCVICQVILNVNIPLATAFMMSVLPWFNFPKYMILHSLYISRRPVPLIVLMLQEVSLPSFKLTNVHIILRSK